MYTSYDPPRFVRLLSLLKEHGSEYLSGQDLSDVLKISRIAVWKHIERLRTLGYAIESDKTYGYKLLQQMDTAYPWEITDGIQTKMLGKISYYFDVINSTQDYAIEMAKDQGKNGAVILAGEQDAGRGRGENTWISPKGGIWMSVILGAPSGFEPTLFPIAAAVSLADAIRETLGADTKLKWPNDLLMNDKKVAGIITDAVLDSKGLGQVVLGVGINYNLDVDEIKKSTKRDVAVLNGAGLKVALIQKFLLKLEEQINSMQQDGGTSMIKQWSAISDTIGAKVTVKSDGKIVKGIATRLDPDGALVSSITQLLESMQHLFLDFFIIIRVDPINTTWPSPFESKTASVIIPATFLSFMRRSFGLYLRQVFHVLHQQVILQLQSETMWAQNLMVLQVLQTSISHPLEIPMYFLLFHALHLALQLE